ncbi:MAG: redoxin domain-containing protein [Candidatus Hydrogenedens sp.]|nr:redoxin domain-containing protein [Candidatus Hydrogenedens sp.]
MRFAIAAIVATAALHAAAADYPKPLDIGSPAPAFDLPGVDGQNHTLDEYADAQVLVIIFTCNHCPTAQAYEDRIIAIHKDYKDKGVALVAISPNDPLALRLDELGYTDVGDSFEDMKIRAAKKVFQFPYLYDGETQAVSRQYGPQSTPHAFVFDKDRKLRYRGRIDDAERAGHAATPDLRNAIDALLAGQPVPVETTRTSGCSTKWSDKRPTVVASLEAWAQEDVALNPIEADAVAAIAKNDSEKLRVVNVWATWCGPCKAEFPQLVEMFRMYRGRDFEMITINIDAPAERGKVLEFLQQQEASMTNYQYTGESADALAEALDPEWEGPVPYTVIIAPGGDIIFRQPGAFEPLEVKRAIVGQIGRIYK